MKVESADEMATTADARQIALSGEIIAIILTPTQMLSLRDLTCRDSVGYDLPLFASESWIA